MTSHDAEFQPCNWAQHCSEIISSFNNSCFSPPKTGGIVKISSRLCATFLPSKRPGKETMKNREISCRSSSVIQCQGFVLVERQEKNTHMPTQTVY